MANEKIETPGVTLVALPTRPGWSVTHHRLFAVSPEEAPNVRVIGGGVTVWDLCFLEDLLHAVNHNKGLLLDVGWYPHADPCGSYRLVVVRQREDKAGQRSGYDWDNPVQDVRTRSLADLLEAIHLALEM